MKQLKLLCLGLAALAATSCGNSDEVAALNEVKDQLLTTYFQTYQKNYSRREGISGPADLKISKYYGTAKDLYFVKIDPAGPSLYDCSTWQFDFNGVVFAWWSRMDMPEVYDAREDKIIKFDNVGEYGLSKADLNRLKERFDNDVSLL